MRNHLGAWLAVLVMAGAWTRPAGYGAAATSPADPAPASAGYFVFLGLNVSTEDHGKLLPVVGASDREMVVQDAGVNSTIPRRNAALSVTLEPKLSRGSVTLDAVDGYPVHSPVTDPAANTQSQMLTMQNVEDHRQTIDEVALGEASRTSLAAANINTAVVGTPDAARGAAAVAQANQSMNNAMSDFISNAANPQFQGFIPDSVGGESNFDGFEVTFRVSAPEPHTDAYGVLRLLLGDRAGSQHAAVALHLFPIRQLDSNPRKIVVRRFGLPVGLKVAAYDVHIYTDGQELATTASQNRVALSEAEALQFLILRHMQLHAGANLPPQVAEELRPEWPRPELAAQWANASIFVHITAEGTVDQINPDAAIQSPLSPELLAAVRKVSFLPALVKGQPAASSGTFALGELFRSQPQS